MFLDTHIDYTGGRATESVKEIAKIAQYFYRLSKDWAGVTGAAGRGGGAGNGTGVKFWLIAVCEDEIGWFIAFVCDEGGATGTSV